mmetsp:Transcript_42237/g.137063  ORF Transcript_42237/g.137063 Transcript_42237/m.137063 type:complete len:186 (+) Transcript_42237:87-644(+)
MLSHLVRAALLLAAVHSLPVPSSSEHAAEHHRRLNRPTEGNVRDAYNQAHERYDAVSAKYRPMVDKLLSSPAPSFLKQFMSTVGGFSADLAWMPKMSAISGMTAGGGGKGNGVVPTADMPKHLAGPGMPDPAMCRNSTICMQIIDHVRNVNEPLQRGQTPPPLYHVVTKNKEATAAAAPAGRRRL